MNERRSHRVLPRLLAVLSSAVFLIAPAIAAPAGPNGQGDDVVAKKKVVEIKITGNASEDPAPENPFGPAQRNFRSKLIWLRQIAADPKVAGVRLEVKSAPDFAHSIDLMNELRKVKAAGKKIVCYSESLDQRTLVFASLADRLSVPPSGGIGLEGLAIQSMYLKELFALLDVKFHVLHIGNYKTAYEEFAADGMSKEQREVLGLLLDEYYKQMLDTIAQNRGIDRAQVDVAFDHMLVEPDEAVKLGLINAVEYEDQFRRQCETVFGGPFEVDDSYGDASKEDLEKMLESPFALFSMLPKLLKPEQPKLKDAPRIAIVYATGPIESGKSQRGFDGSVSGMGSETIVEALDKARDDDWVKAVILRVNSPGGSALASDMINRAVVRCREKKPVIASMGWVAGSGGYWISMNCDKIIAQPSTITGSIGVVGMLPDVSATLKRFGVKVETVTRGPHGEDLAMMKAGPSEFLKTTITESMKRVYDRFVAKAAEGRHMDPKQLEPLARGRVWTGRQALDLNLVDQLGGLDDAIALACQLGGGLDPATAEVAEYPLAPNLFDTIQDQLGEMTTTGVRGSAARIALASLGLEDWVGTVDGFLHERSALDPANVQCVMPFAFTVK